MNTDTTPDKDRDTVTQLLDALEGGARLTVLTRNTQGPTAKLSQDVLDGLPERSQAAVIGSPRLSLTDFLHRACDALGAPVPPDDHSITSLQNALHRHVGQRPQERPLLILDEAQDAPFYVLWQLMALAEPKDAASRPIQVVLVGQPGLEEVLGRPEMAPLIPRIDARCRLDVWPAPLAAEPAAPPDAVPEDASQLAPEAEPARAAKEAAAPVPRAKVSKPASSRRPGALWLGVVGLTAVIAAVALWQPEWLGSATPAPQAVRPTTPAPAAPAVAAVAPPPVASAPSPEAAPAPAPVAAAPAPVAPAPAAAPEPTPPSPPPALSELVDDAAATWGVLAARWNARLTTDKPCEEALEHLLQCYRRPDMTVAMLRQFDRPGLVELKADGQTRWVHLQAMAGDTVTLSSTGRTWTLPMAAFTAQWSGAYSTLWRLPPGQNSKVFTALPDTPAGQWLDQQLKQLQASGKLAASEDSLAARVSALQKAQQWPVDGKALPTVLLLVNRLADVPEPRLLTAPGGR
ncbi:MAG: AAA family ATPase [Hydrogenophaga sp.]|nr:AAA family ATPase [Hydrogenophaga sp.]